MNDKNDDFRYPLHITISSLFIGLIIIFGAALTWQNYHKTSQIIVSAGNQLFDQISSELRLEYQSTYQTVTQAVNILALSPVSQANTLEQRLQSLDMFKAALNNKAHMSAIQVGYADGGFFIVRPVNSEYIRTNFAAPSDAAYIADNISIDKQGKQTLERIFFNQQLQEISRNNPEQTLFDPRNRPWYKQALENGGIATTRPYLFYFMRKVGATFAMQSPVKGVVIAADITLDQLSDKLAQFQLSPSAEVVLFGRDGGVIAYRDAQRLITETETGGFAIAHLPELGSDVLAHLGNDLKKESGQLAFSFGNQFWLGAVRKMHITKGIDLYVLMVSPEHELLSDAINIRNQSVLITGLIVLLAIPIIWLFAKTIANPMRRLAVEAGKISRFDFSSPIETRSAITEVNELAESMVLMKNTISKFLLLINSIAAEKNLDALLEGITRESRLVTQADGALIFLFDDKGDRLVPGILQNGGQETVNLPVFLMGEEHQLVDAAKQKNSSLIKINAKNPDVLNVLLGKLNTDSINMIAQPLRNSDGDLVGLLCLLYREQESHTPEEVELSFVQAFSGFAAVTLEGRRLLLMQKELLNSFIKLIAGAIDSKSPYTGGHCQRVPEITRMLAQAACDSNELPFNYFQLDEEGWEELHIASWLHDCGKVTTPEFVVDKATKLEAIYDRIHEIRMRFEVLKRDAEIRFWQLLSEGGGRAELSRTLHEEWQQLDQDFAFVAQCNIGGEFMAEEKLDRLESIAEKTWTRTLDDNLGISWEEKQRKQSEKPVELPAQERLLTDKPEHLFRRDEKNQMPADNRWGFKLDVPKYKYNRGELYNLKISRGTLSAEDRFMINDHIVQTIIMLDKLPFPRHLRNVPEIAGAHHETMDGQGYPKKLEREQMPLTARMMAIADIFEALTASDRPYKKAKKLSEALKIMAYMKKDRHIDPDLFELFLTSGVYRQYGSKFLGTEQMDEVDIKDYLD